MIRLADSVPSSLDIYIYPLTCFLEDARMLQKPFRELGLGRSLRDKQLRVGRGIPIWTE